MARKTSTLAAAVSTAAGKKNQDSFTAKPSTKRSPAGEQAPGRQGTGGVMIGGLFPPNCRKVLKQLEVDTGKKLRQLLGEAINDLAAKYGQPHPFREDA